MRIDFRQGIIKYPSTGSTQNFLSYSGGYVSLIGSNGNTDVAAAHASENYLITESATVSNAWGPLPTGTMCWLYWDINLRTAVRTFGYTTVQPITSSSQPALVEDQHWFNTIDTTMYVCSGGTYRAVCRVFAASVIDGLFASVSDGMQSKPYAGTQVGINVAGTRVGNIIIDADGDPIRRVDGRFFTTEDEFFVNGAPINAVKLDAGIVPATADTMLPRYYVVKFTDFGRINLATYEDVQTSTLALLTEDLTTHQTGYVIVQGCVTNPEWNWDTLSNLWVVGNGELTTVDPHLSDPVHHPIKKPPVGRVVSHDTIIFDQGLGGIGADGPPGAGTSLATSYSFGISRLTLEAADPSDPVVAGDNDPRLSDARVPLAHTQAASTIIPLSYGSLTGANLQYQLQQIEDGKVDVAGDTMTGSLILNADPTVDLEAATKHYVDIHTQDISGLVAKAGDTMTGSLILNADPTVDLEAATKHYVDSMTPDLSSRVAKAGDTMTGLLVLSADPFDDLGAATKQYVDNINHISQQTSALTITDTGIVDTEQLTLTLGGVQRAAFTSHSVDVQGAAIPDEWAQYIYNIQDRSYAPASTIDSDGNAVIADAADQVVYVYKVAPSGDIVWTIGVDVLSPGAPVSITVDSQNNAYVAYEFDDLDTVGTHIMAISPIGDVLWDTTLASGIANSGYSATAASITLDSNGNIIASGWLHDTSGAQHCYIAKLSSVGVIVWSKVFPDLSISGDYYRYLVTTEGTDIYLVSNYGVGIDANISVIKLDGLGDIVWQYLHNSSLIVNASVVDDISVVNGHLYFGGVTWDENNTAINIACKIDALTGTVVWIMQITPDLPIGPVRSCAVDPISNVSYWAISAPSDIDGNVLASEVTIVSLDIDGNPIIGHTLGERVNALGSGWHAHKALTYRNGWLWLTMITHEQTGTSGTIVNAHLSLNSFMMGGVTIDPPFDITPYISFVTDPLTPTASVSTLAFTPVSPGQTPTSITTFADSFGVVTNPTYVVTEVFADTIYVRDTVVLGRDPIENMDAVTKQYVDTTQIIATFQVGAPPPTSHVHYAHLYKPDAELLILGEISSVVLTPIEQLGHTHPITVIYNNVDATFEVSNIGNNLLDNHVAYVIDYGASKSYPPITGFASGLIAQTSTPLVGFGFQQRRIMTKLSVTEIKNTPVFTLDVPVPYDDMSLVPSAIGFALSNALPRNPMDGFTFGYVVFTDDEYEGVSFVDPYSPMTPTVVPGTEGTGVPMGYHSVDVNDPWATYNTGFDYSAVRIHLPASTPPAHIIELRGLTPNSPTGLSAVLEATYALRLTLTNADTSVISTIDINIIGADAQTMTTLIDAINQVLIAGYDPDPPAIRCAWSFNNSLVFVVGSSQDEQIATYVTVDGYVTDGVFAAIDAYYDGLLGVAPINPTTPIPSTGPQPSSMIATNTSSTATGLRWHIPIVGSNRMFMPQQG